MQYAGWVVSFYNIETKENSFKGPFCVIDRAQECARNLKKQYSFVKIYHLILENNNQV